MRTKTHVVQKKRQLRGNEFKCFVTMTASICVDTAMTALQPVRGSLATLLEQQKSDQGWKGVTKHISVQKAVG